MLIYQVLTVMVLRWLGSSTVVRTRLMAAYWVARSWARSDFVRTPIIRRPSAAFASSKDFLFGDVDLARASGKDNGP